MIRLQRVGKKHDPSFRIVVTDSKNSTKSGRFTEVLGHYDGRGGRPQLKKERISHWLSVGAKASGTVHNILVKNKLVNDKKVNVLPKKKVGAAKPETAEAPKA